MDPTYEAKVFIDYELFSFLDIALESRYKFLPMKYTLKTYDSGTTSFVDTKKEIEETITYNAVKLFFKHSILDDYRVMIAYAKEETKGKNILEKTTYSDSQDKFLIGLNTKF